MSAPIKMHLCIRSKRAERWAAPEPARIPSGDRPAYTSEEGQTFERAERWAAPEPARIPSGDRPTYTSDEGQT
jgi:hypothetical protein